MAKKHKKRKKQKRQYNPNLNATDTHHLLFIGRFWDRGRSTRLLRNHWYCKIEIPKNTLHREIHAELKDIMLPSEENCYNAYNKLLDLEEHKIITEQDPIWVRLEVLSRLFGKNEPCTVRCLRKQLQIVNNFYKRPQ